MLIVISSPRTLAKESQLINRLFEEGMALFHLRKPGASEEKCKKLLDGIPAVYWDKIALHQHHHLAKDYGMARQHIPGWQRTAGNPNHLRIAKEGPSVYSTSIHSVEEYFDLKPSFSYVFLSPVFNSISKPGYKGQHQNLALLKGKRKIPIIGLSGVRAENCQQVYSMGFDGVAVSGGIWESSHPIGEFIKLKEKCAIHAL